MEDHPRPPHGDYAAEGLKWLATRGATVFGLRPEELWRRWTAGEGLPCWVVRFEVVE